MGNTHRSATILSIGIILCLASTARADFADRAIPTGATLPSPGDLLVNTEISGLFVKDPNALGNGDAGVLQLGLVWNYAIVDTLGLFGRHHLWGLSWGDLSLLAFGHEVGLRFKLGPHLAFETAYLTHRVEYQWIEGNPYSLGGLHDHGGEFGVILHGEVARRLRIEARLIGRFFAEPKNENTSSYTDQIVFGAGVRAVFALFPRNEVEIDFKTLRVYRGPSRRSGVDEVTWNLLADFKWLVRLTQGFGVFIGARASTSFWCGEVPMMEIKRSMINEPMAEGTAGLFFTL